MLDKTKPKPFSGALLFPSPEAMFEAMFGPEQHDFHVREWKLNQAVAGRQAWNAEADLRLKAATADIIARTRAAR